LTLCSFTETIMPARSFVLRLGCTLAALAGLSAAARGDFIVIPQPNAAYQAATLKFDVPNSGPALQSLVSGDLTISFSAPMNPLQAGPGHFTWGHPPFVEDTAPAVLYSQNQLTRVLTFSEPLQTFGLEMVPNLTVFFPATLTADFFSGDTLVGTIQQRVSQFDARLFAATDTDAPFTSVWLTSSSGSFGFLVGDVRAAVAVPEPTSLGLFGLGLAGAVGYGWRRRRIRSPRNRAGRWMNSDRGVARDPRDAVEVRVAAGDFGQAVGLHERDRDGIIR
jgi:hypothetical protein